MKFVLAFSFLIATLLGASSQDIQKSKYLLKIGKTGEARNILKQIQANDPENEQAYYYLGQSYLDKENPDSARIYYKMGTEEAPKSGLNYVGLAKLEQASNSGKSQEYISKALDLGKKDPETVLEIADFYTLNKKSDKALEVLEVIKKKESKNPYLFLALGDAYLQKNDGNNALQNYERNALPLNPGLPDTYVKIGRLYSRTRNYDMAMEFYTKAIQKDNQFSPAYQEVAEVYFKAGLYKKAIEAYDKYLAIADKDADSDFRYASFIFLNKDYEKALSILEPLVNKQKDNAVLYRLIGYSHYELGNYDEGLANMEKFFSKAKEAKILSTDYEYLGKIYGKKEKKDEAIKNYEKALEMDPDNYDLYIEIGNIYFLEKNFSEAEKAYEGKLSRTKGSPNDYLNFGKMIYYQEKFEKADSVFEILATQIPKLPHGYLWQAKALEQLDSDEENGKATAAYEKFIETTTGKEDKYKADLVRAYSYLGSYYSLTNNIDKAAVAWKKVQEFDPDNTSAKEALKNY